MDAVGRAADRAGPCCRDGLCQLEPGAATGGALLGGSDLDGRAVAVAEPQPIAVDAGRRRAALDPKLAQPFVEARHVIGEGAEREVTERPARSFDQARPGMMLDTLYLSRPPSEQRFFDHVYLSRDSIRVSLVVSVLQSRALDCGSV